MRPDDETWQLLNAYHDGELDPARRAEVEARLWTSPALTSALDDIREISQSLRQLHPAGEAVQPHVPKRRFPIAAIAAIAAMLVMVAGLFLTGYSGGGDGAAQTPLEWHALLARQAYPVAPQTDKLTPVAQIIGRDLDLSSANLKLVDAVSQANGDIFLHYAGVNGCRLTLGSFAAAPDLPAQVGGLLVDSWTADGLHYALIAQGMDNQRFAAVSALLVHATQNHQPEIRTARLAVQEATKQALPCA